MGNDTAPGQLFEPFTGLIDEVRVWNVARSADEIAASMNGCIAGNPATLVANYRLDDGPNSATASDHSASNATGVLVNMNTSQSWVSPGAVTCDQLKLVGLEVVQVVQDWKNTVPLVAGKKTVVRAHLEAPVGGGFMYLQYRLRAFGGPGLDQPLTPAFVLSPLAVVDVPAVADLAARASSSRSVLFELPNEWLSAGPRRFTLEPVNLATTCAELTPPQFNDCSVSVDFSERKPMVLNLIRTRFKHSNGTVSQSTRTDLDAVCAQFLQRFPTASVTCYEDPNLLEFSSDNYLKMLADVEKRKWRPSPLGNGCFWSDCEDFYLAVTAFNARVKEGEYVSGLAQPLKDNDWWYRAAFAVHSGLDATTAAHEIGHSLRLDHPSKQVVSSPQGNWKTGTCGTEPEQADFETRYAPDNSEFYPFYSGNDPLLGPLGNDQLVVFGFDTRSSTVVPHSSTTLMSYCPSSIWFDKGSYVAMFEALAPTETVVSEPAANSTPYFYISGTVDLETDSAELEPAEVLIPPFTPPGPPATSDWELLVLKGAASPDVTPLEVSALPGLPLLIKFAAFVEFDAAITGFAVRRNGQTLTELNASSHPPTIAITAPTPGAGFLLQDIELHWQSEDLDGDPLSFNVEYSADGGASWTPLALGWPASPFVVNSESIQPSGNALFRVTALDGFHSTSDTLDGPIAIQAELVHEDGFE